MPGREIEQLVWKRGEAGEKSGRTRASLTVRKAPRAKRTVLSAKVHRVDCRLPGLKRNSKNLHAN